MSGFDPWLNAAMDTAGVMVAEPHLSAESREMYRGLLGHQARQFRHSTDPQVLRFNSLLTAYAAFTPEEASHASGTIYDLRLVLAELLARRSARWTCETPVPLHEGGLG